MRRNVARNDRVRLGDIAKVVSGFAFKSSEFRSEGIPVIKIKNIRVGTVDLTDADSVDESFLALDRKYHVEVGDLLISLTGSHLTQPGSVVGRVALHTASLTKCLLNQRAGKIIIRRPERCDSRFLFYQLLTEEKRRAIALMASGAASQANVSPGQVESLELVLPPLETQRQVAAVLSAYDDLIENNTRRIEILEAMAQAIYREWFVRFRFPGYEGVKMVESPVGQIPEGWEPKTVGAISANFDSKRKPLSKMEREKIRGPYPYYGAAKIFDHINDYIFDGQYLLVAEDGSVTTQDGKPVLQLATGKFWPNNHTHVLQGAAGVSTELLYLVLREVQISGYITGAAQPKITQANLNRIPVLVPASGVRLRFQSFAQHAFAQMEILERKNANLRLARDLLLPRLVAGEVEVTNLDSDVDSVQ